MFRQSELCLVMWNGSTAHRQRGTKYIKWYLLQWHVYYIKQAGSNYTYVPENNQHKEENE